MRNYSLFTFLLLSTLGLFYSCSLDNIEDQNRNPKTDYTSFNYVLATEDATSTDITRFFSFNLDGLDTDYKYDLIDENHLFVNSDPSTSSGQHFFKNYFFSMAKDKRGFSSTPGLFRLSLNTSNRVFIDNEIYMGKDNLFPTRKLCIVDESTGFFYNESVLPQGIQRFNPTTMQITGEIDLRPHIADFKPDVAFEDPHGNSLVRTGSLVIDSKEDKLYVSVVFLEEAAFNLISDEVTEFYLAVIDIPSMSFEKMITYPKAQTVGFFVTENHSTTKDEDGNLYFGSWGWNQFNEHRPSKVFRIKAGETDFDLDWEIEIEPIFGPQRILQSIISYNNKIYLHVSDSPYLYSSSDEVETSNDLKMNFYEFDIEDPTNYRKLDLPSSNSASRVNLFSILDDKLFIAVPNAEEGKINGIYSLDRNGDLKQEFLIDNKYRPTRLYKLSN